MKKLLFRLFYILLHSFPILSIELAIYSCVYTKEMEVSYYIEMSKILIIQVK